MRAKLSCVSNQVRPLSLVRPLGGVRVLAVTAVLLASCASISNDWSQAVRSDEIAAYRVFLERWGDADSPYVQRAEQRIAELRRIDQAWPKLRVGMSMEEVASLLPVPAPLEPELLKRIQKVIEAGKRDQRSALAMTTLSATIYSCLKPGDLDLGCIFLKKLTKSIEVGNSDSIGSPHRFLLQICWDRDDRDCIELRSVSEAERFVSSVEKRFLLHRVGPDYELQFNDNLELRRWRRRGGF